MNKEKTAILLMNVGSPDRPEVKSVNKFLTQFLNDKRVIDLPWLLRKFLVNGIIIPFRVKNSTRLYQKLWTEKGSPLIFYSLEMKEKLQQRLDDNTKVFVGMRYGNPGYKSAISEIKKDGFNRLLIFPLYPQFAMSTTETSVIAVEDELKRQKYDIKTSVVEQFYDHPLFINAFAEQAQKYDIKKYDHIVFSYHGLPNRQIEKCHPGIKVQDCQCNGTVPEHGTHCYRATCFATSLKIANALDLDKKDYSISFQSRLSRNWLSPFTDELLLGKLKEGKKNILVLAPSFVTDCLETIVEIGEDYGELFKENGGETLQMVDSLNAEPQWIEAMLKIIDESLKN
jgi:protoporphyrin/coproporphyrin ferrochelatase